LSVDLELVKIYENNIDCKRISVELDVDGKGSEDEDEELLKESFVI